MAGLITQYASGESQRLIAEVESASQVLVKRWGILSNQGTLSKEEIGELEQLEGRVQGIAKVAISTLDCESHSSPSIRETLRQRVATHCENAVRITQQARMKMGASTRVGSASCAGNTASSAYFKQESRSTLQSWMKQAKSIQQEVRALRERKTFDEFFHQDNPTDENIRRSRDKKINQLLGRMTDFFNDVNPENGRSTGFQTNYGTRVNHSAQIRWLFPSYQPKPDTDEIPEGCSVYGNENRINDFISMVDKDLEGILEQLRQTMTVVTEPSLDSSFLNKPYYREEAGALVVDYPWGGGAGAVQLFPMTGMKVENANGGMRITVQNYPSFGSTTVLESLAECRAFAARFRDAYPDMPQPFADLLKGILGGSYDPYPWNTGFNDVTATVDGYPFIELQGQSPLETIRVFPEDPMLDRLKIVAGKEEEEEEFGAFIKTLRAAGLEVDRPQPFFPVGTVCGQRSCRTFLQGLLVAGVFARDSTLQAKIEALLAKNPDNGK